MPRVLHIVTTAGFAGVERYVCDIAELTAARGWEVAVVGGDRERMVGALDDRVLWEPGATVLGSARSIRRLGQFDVCHAHMTAAESVALLTAGSHRAPIVATRHFAARRGASLPGRVGAPLIAARITREIAISEFVARSIERPPDVVLVSGVREAPDRWRPESRVVVMLQRLEPEKDTLTALRAWQHSGIAELGWSLRIFGEGSERARLEHWVESERAAGITFGGWTDDVPGELSRAGALLASARAEPLGLSVLDAMASGVPVVATASGGHLETVGLVADAPLFPAGDPQGGARALDAIGSDAERLRLSIEGRRVVAAHFAIDRHVERLLEQYQIARGGGPALGGDRRIVERV